MARTTAANFTGGLQFPYATAGTDLFHKEDVQTLALAVDQHTHGTGKGLPLDAAAIASGLITSAMIANGTIAGADIAAATIAGGNIASGTIAGGNIASGTITGGNIASGTITGGNIASGSVEPTAMVVDHLSQTTLVSGTTSSPTTTSGTFSVIPEMTLSITLPVRSLVIWYLTGVFQNSAAASCLFQTDIVSTAASPLQYYNIVASTVNQLFSVSLLSMYTAVAGTYTVRGSWAVQSAGTLSRQGANSTLSVARVALGG